MLRSLSNKEFSRETKHRLGWFASSVPVTVQNSSMSRDRLPYSVLLGWILSIEICHAHSTTHLHELPCPVNLPNLKMISWLVWFVMNHVQHIVAHIFFNVHDIQTMSEQVIFIIRKSKEDAYLLPLLRRIVFTAVVVFGRCYLELVCVWRKRFPISCCKISSTFVEHQNARGPV